MLLVILLLFFPACSNGSDTIEQEVPPPTAGVASVALMLEVGAIDPSSDLGDPLVTAATLTLSTAELVYDDGSRHLIADAPRTLDLLAATNTITLGVADVPPGTITAVDVLVDSASVTRDGEILAVSGVRPTSIAVPSVTVELDCTRIVTASFDPNTAFDFVPPDDPDPEPGECDEVFDFEGLSSGTKLRDQLAPAVTVSCDNARSGGPDECLVFDTDNITGGDDDLTEGNGNVVIIAENVTDSDGDGLVDDPDDDARGGVQIYMFDPPIDVDSVFVVDIDLNEDNGKLVVTRADGTTTERELPPIGNASIQTIDVREENVVRFEVHLPSSGGVDDIAYHVDCDEPGEPGPGSFDFDPMFEFVDSELICDEMPPDPELMAPPLNPYVLTPFDEQTSFLYDGPDAIQTGVDPNAIDDARVVVLRGAVLDNSGAPLPAVTVTSLSPGFGQTMSRIDGRYDFATNGGGAVTLQYTAEGYVGVQRTLQTQWNEYVAVEDVVMTPLDPNVTTVAFPPAASLVARGTTVSDNDGPRTATLIFEPGTLATLEFTDGSTAPTSSLDIRLTEFTVGERGQQAMPALLPPASGYTYAVELSADEAGTNVARINFSQPVPLYVENFIGFPVGTDVPTGFYDRQRAQWVPVNDGRVIAIVGESGGLAELDVDGDGVADDASMIGVTNAERAQLASTYTVGDQLWRVALDHFTPLDLNFPTLDFDAPEGPVLSEPPVDEPCTATGSVIECENQVLRERIALAGTSHDLVYTSASAAGYRGEQSLTVFATGDAVDPLIERVEVQIDIAGQTQLASFSPDPNLQVQFTWDGLDSYGREVVGAVDYKVTIRYFHPLLYLAPDDAVDRSFARVGVPGSNLDPGWGTFCRVDAAAACIVGATERQFSGTLGGRRTGRDFAGWTLSGYHSLDPASGTLLLGDGSRRNTVFGLQTILGGGDDASIDDGDPGTTLDLSADGRIDGIATTPDGTTFVLLNVLFEGSQLLEVSPGGVVTTHAIDPDTTLDALPRALTSGPDGAVYYAAALFESGVFDNRAAVFRHDPSGPDVLVAGLGAAETNDGSFQGSALEVGFDDITAIEVDPSGNLYVAEISNIQSIYLWLVTPDGFVGRYAGSENGFGADGNDGAALDASLSIVSDLAADASGNVYLQEDFNIRRIDAEGTITTVGGESGGGSNLNGQSASDVVLGARSLATDAAGGLYFRSANSRIYRIDAEGIIQHIAGNGTQGATARARRPSRCCRMASSPWMRRGVCSWSMTRSPRSRTAVSHGSNHRLEHATPRSSCRTRRKPRSTSSPPTVCTSARTSRSRAQSCGRSTTTPTAG